ncbi:MAG: hypothetical protein JW966_08855 [Anaerolineae bacterium]|nr:hypothetical protein [Anaerolineae bacterium]
MPVLHRIILCGLCLAAVVTAVVLPARPLVRSLAQANDTITIGVTDLPNSLDAGEAYDFVAWEVLGHLYTGLTRQVPGTFDYELALATGVDISEDKLTYIFTLDGSAVFSDGTPITAQTFVDSITRVQTLERDADDAITPYVASVEATADGKLVFQLTRPVPFFLGLVSLPPYAPQHPTLAAAQQPVPFPDAIIGNGPYLLDSFDVGDTLVLKANPAYDLGPQPATSTIVLQRFERSQDLRDAVRDHIVDMAWRALFLGDVDQLVTIDGLNLVEIPSTRVFYLHMNHDTEPCDDPLVREAVTLLLDRDSIVELGFGGHATALTSMIPADFPEAYAPIWPAERDQERAEEVLRAAAYSPRGSSRLIFAVYTSRFTYGDLYAGVAAELVRSSFSPTDFIDSGVYAEVDTSTFIRALERGEGRLTLFGWTPIVPHPDAYLRPLAHSDAPIAANAKYARPLIDSLLDDAAALDDPAAQGELYRAAANELLTGYDIAPLWQDHIQLFAWDDISGIQIEPNFFLHYDLLKRR